MVTYKQFNLPRKLRWIKILKKFLRNFNIKQPGQTEPEVINNNDTEFISKNSYLEEQIL